MDQPPEATLAECLSVLREIKCITEEPLEEITPYGREVSRIPLPPRLGHLLLLSLEHKCQALMLSVLSILSIENLFLSSAVSEKGSKKTNLYEVLTKYLPTLHSSDRGEKAGVLGREQANRLITSDHLAKANILHEYEKSKNKGVFCKQNYLNRNNMKRAVMIR